MRWRFMGWWRFEGLKVEGLMKRNAEAERSRREVGRRRLEVESWRVADVRKRSGGCRWWRRG